MGTIEQICLSLKGSEIEKWEKLRRLYPERSKHDILYFGMISLLNKNYLKKTKDWKKLRKNYPSDNDWSFLKKVLEKHNLLTQ